MLYPDDKTLTAKIAEGNSEAENYLFSHFREKIQFMVRVRLRGKVSGDDQEDIVSEVQQAVLVSLRKGGFNPERGKPLEAYIAGIASNIVGQYFRKLKREKVIDNLEKAEDIESPENTWIDLINKERKEKLRNCFKRLKEKYKEILILRIYEDKSIEEIANQLNLEKRRVSERINYAFKLLLKECQKEKYFQYYDDSDK